MTVSHGDASYSVVPARSRDLARLSDIELAAARLLVGQAPESVLAETTSASDFDRACRAGRLWVALSGDTAVGFARVEILEAGVAHLDELDVHPDHGRRGLGRRLVGAVCEWAAHEQLDAVTLSTFRNVPWNMAFYAKLGFSVIPADRMSRALAKMVEDETRRGLDPMQRVIMRRALAKQPAWSFGVRTARAADMSRMLEVWERSVRATHDFLTTSDVAGLKPLVAKELQNGSIGWWVLELAERVVGFLGFANDSIEALFIDPDWTGKGGGTLLVDHAQRLAGGVLAVDVNDQNEAARRFYESRGFAVVGRSPVDSGGRPFPILHMRRVR